MNSLTQLRFHLEIVRLSLFLMMDYGLHAPQQMIRGSHVQHLSIDIDPETYIAQISPARTFTIYEEIEELLKIGKIRGGSLDSAIVIKGDKILSKEPLRFDDEFVRHKILDIVGDFSLLGNH